MKHNTNTTPQTQTQQHKQINTSPTKQKKYPFITNVRGVGTFLAFDLRTTEEQQKFLVEIRQKGVEMTGSGNASIRLRPMLIFAPQHVVQMIERMDAVLKTFPK